MAKYENKILTMLSQITNHLHMGVGLTNHCVYLFQVHPRTYSTDI